MANPSSQTLTRRSVLCGLAGLMASGLMAGKSIQAAAGSRRIPYGAAVEFAPFRDDAAYRRALLQHADMLVPMNALKWATLRPAEAAFDFSRADAILDFARQNGKSTRGHTLLWYAYNPDWLNAVDTRRKAERLLIEHIETVVDRYKDRVPSWDVVNEVVAHDPLKEGRWREGLWLRHLGRAHVEIAFRAAARTDPKAKLVINDYDLENKGKRFDARRQAILSIVRNLQDLNLPVHGVGLQAHLYAEREIDRDGLAEFVGRLASMGVRTLVTELDVIDWRLSKNPIKRDIGAANVVSEFLEAVSVAGQPESVVTWGITDRYSWISDVFKRRDGAPNRPLPLDANYQPKPMLDVIERFRLS